MATSANEWRKARTEGVDIELPSGFTVRLRPIEVDFFVRIGEIPSVLTSTVNDLIDGKSAKLAMPELQTPDEWREWIAFLNHLVASAFVSPSIGDWPVDGESEVRTTLGENEISIDDVSYEDKTWVFGFFARPARMLRMFRETQKKHVPVVANAGDDAHESVKSYANIAVGEALHEPA